MPRTRAASASDTKRGMRLQSQSIAIQQCEPYKSGRGPTIVHNDTWVRSCTALSCLEPAQPTHRCHTPTQKSTAPAPRAPAARAPELPAPALPPGRSSSLLRLLLCWPPLVRRALPQSAASARSAAPSSRARELLASALPGIATATLQTQTWTWWQGQGVGTTLCCASRQKY